MVSKKEQFYKSANPEILAVNWEGIPDRLRNMPRWVLWKLAPKPDKEGKKQKVPLQCKPAKRGYKTKDGIPLPCYPISKEDHWLTFEHAKRFLEQWGKKFKLGGVGIMLGKLTAAELSDQGLTGNVHLCGVDLDDCFADDGSLSTPWRTEIVSAAKSYVETSPSKTGLKALCFAEIPAGFSAFGHEESDLVSHRGLP